MATFRMNMNGLASINAVDDNYVFPSDRIDSIGLDVLQNDFLGFQPTIISDITDIDTEANIGTLSIAEVTNRISVDLNDPGNITVGTFTFTYTIKDSFDREDTATVTIEIIPA
jgi:hypothetical protein